MVLQRTPRMKVAIMVMVYQFCKMAHFIAFHKCDDAIYIMDLFFQEIARFHGVPRTITSDRNTKFLSHFWRYLWRLVGTKLLFSTICHPQTDVRTELTNRTLTTLRRGMVNRSLSDWDIKLPHAEFAYNRSPSYATWHSPFEVCYVLHFLTPFDLVPIPQETKVRF